MLGSREQPLKVVVISAALKARLKVTRSLNEKSPTVTILAERVYDALSVEFDEKPPGVIQEHRAASECA